MRTPATFIVSCCSILASSDDTQLAHAGSCLCPNMHDCCCRYSTLPSLIAFSLSALVLRYVRGSWKHWKNFKFSPAGRRLKKPVMSRVAKKSPLPRILHSACRPRYLNRHGENMSFPPDDVMSDAILAPYSVPYLLKRQICFFL